MEPSAQRLRYLEEAMSESGFPDWGICRFCDLPPLLPCRARSRLPEGACSVVMAVLPYYVGEYPQRNLSRYCLVDDYHLVGREMLDQACGRLAERFPGEQFAGFVDSSPLPEVQAGWLSGLGVIGRNGQLIHPRFGSYCFLAGIVTTLSLPPSQPVAGGCLGCGACQRACPTGALGPEGFDRSRCRSQITQKKGELTAWEMRQVREGGLAWGCDRCLDACPMNRGVPLTPIAAFRSQVRPVLTAGELQSPPQRRAYLFRGTGVLLRNLELIGQGDGPQRPQEGNPPRFDDKE